VDGAPQAAYAAINRLVVPTNATVRREAIDPPLPGPKPAPLPSPDYDTNTWFQALADNGSNTNPDTHRAVGPNHIMTALHSEVRIQNRTGTTNYLTRLLKNFWTNAGAVELVFDPRALYDPYQNRWITTAAYSDEIGH